MSATPVLSSRLLRRLDAAIHHCTHPVEQACLKAERAALLARLGHVAAAREAIAGLHAQFDIQPQPPVSAWLALAEGLADYFDDLSLSAREQIQRALALAGAARLPPLRALASAWLAQFHYAAHEFGPMTSQLAEALRLAGPELPGARARASMVAAVSLHFAGRFDLALPWYHRTRDDAAIEGDDATISAVMHNMSGLRISNARLAALFGDDPGDEVRHALLGAQSTENFDLGVGTASLLHLVPMLRAQAHLLQGDVAEALALYRTHLDPALADGLGWQEGSFRADMAWCLLTEGAVDEARQTARAAAQALARGDADADDLACGHARLAEVLARLGDADAAARHRRLAQASVTEHRRQQAEVMALHQREIGPLLGG